MATSTIRWYLLQRLQEIGIHYICGVPSDYTLSAPLR